MITLIFAPLIEGHPIDINDFIAWANHAYTAGLPRFYEGVFADYPPGYVYVLYVIGWLRHLLALDFHSGVYIVLVKLPAMMADLASGCLLYSLAKRRLGEAAGTGLAMLYLLNPVVFLNSTLWGQIDSIFTLLALLMILALTGGKLTTATVVYAAALLIKPQSLMFAPLLLLVGFIEKKDWRVRLRSGVSGIAAFAALLIPFSLYRDPLWIVELYRKSLSVYDLVAFNAFNLYALFGKNGAPMSADWLAVPYRIWDIAAVLLTVPMAACLFFKSKSAGKYAYIGMLIALLIFLLKTGMHERYGYPALLLALVSYFHFADKRILNLFLGLSLTHFANTAYVLRKSLDQHYFVPNGDMLMVAVSLANIALTAYAVKLGFELLAKPAE